MSSWDEFCGQRHGTIERFVNGDAGPYKQLWSHTDDVTIFGGWGAYEQGWDAVSRRLDWAASYLPNEHPRWPLHRAELIDLTENLTRRAGVPVSETGPVRVL